MNLQTPLIVTSPKFTAPPWVSRRSSRGFTLIEVLVVIGIILILMGLFYLGLKIVTGQAKERDTRTMLETCKTMFENYRSATHLSRPPPRGTVGSPMSVVTNNQSGDYGNASANANRFWTVGQEAAPGVVSTDPNFYNLQNSPNYSSLPEVQTQALVNTAYVMYGLKSLPENVTILSNIPAAKILNVSIIVQKTGQGGVRVTVPILLDGWGNPILFVPGGGLGYYLTTSPGFIYLDGTNIGIVTSGGVITNNTTPPLSSYDAANPPAGLIIANQPFFVSAGPDGDFSNVAGNKTDDNIYSFK